jgi:hypothetical protein
MRLSAVVFAFVARSMQDTCYWPNQFVSGERVRVRVRMTASSRCVARNRDHPATSAKNSYFATQISTIRPPFGIWRFCPISGRRLGRRFRGKVIPCMGTSMIYLYLTGVHPTSVHLMGRVSHGRVPHGRAPYGRASHGRASYETCISWGYSSWACTS